MALKLGDAELARMAMRGEEDGHDRLWFSSIATSHHDMDVLIRSANQAKTAIDAHFRDFVPNPRIGIIDLD